MAVIKRKPTSPGLRGMVQVRVSGLHKGKPHAALVAAKKSKGGRNNLGRITVRHRGGGHKRRLRKVDFRRDKDGIAAKVERIEHDPNRSAPIALLCYADGERRYIVAPEGVAPGASVENGPQAPIKPGNCLPLANIPVGTTLHCVELTAGKGAQLARSAGTAIQMVALEQNTALVRLRSGEIRRVSADCRASVGSVGKSEHFLRKLGKAGANIWRGRRPGVRGMVMNPIDHPMGGGEGRSKSNKIPCSPTGVPSKGYRTRSNKRTDKLIVSSRHRRKKR